MIHVYTGNGKGKTTASVGLGIRAVGAGKKVLMVQFLKDGKSSEIKIIKKINGFDIKWFGRPGVLSPNDIGEEDKVLVNRGIEFIKNNMNRYDIIIMDEINVAMKMRLAKQKDVIDLIKNSKEKEWILTGRYAPRGIIKVADLVTEFKEIKHYFNKGVPARKGIEF
ncbi:MAG: cob(I)yrinic acid a,c-diamide adenosyltransferase [Candidatus Aenigmarchaeota archaeon]|nr:cob(I)yrinic acid a,c-diamide adenosyltransferase [Candidatus Aenigmarchaeota archaeon]